MDATVLCAVKRVLSTFHTKDEHDFEIIVLTSISIWRSVGVKLSKCYHGACN